MDAFEVHRRLIGDYRGFTEGFVQVRDPRVAEVVARESERGAQWPDPWLSLNPSFASGGRIDELVASGLLHPECERIFRAKSGPDDRGSTPSDAAPAPARGHRGRIPAGVLRPDHRHRVRQVAGLHRADRRPRPEARVRPGRAGDRCLPDERAGELPDGGAAQVPGVRLRRPSAGHVRAVHRAGEARPSARRSWQIHRTSC